MRFSAFFLTFLLSGFFAHQPNLRPNLSDSQKKITPRLRLVMKNDTLPDTLSVWVYLKDKGQLGFTKPYPRDVVSERSIKRRLKIRSESEVIDFSDLPVNEDYVKELSPFVLAVHHRSRWFNGVSVRVLKTKVSNLTELPFVEKVDLIDRYGVSNPLKENSEPVRREVLHDLSGDSLDYGNSFKQLNQLNVPEVHKRGIYGQGVLVGIFDDGFKLLSHESLRHLDIVATYDFAENKISVVPSDTFQGGGGHGVSTLSTIAGYAPGRLIGPAFKASFVIARTEVSSSETSLEEDNWLAAIEWADSIGIDVASTSLGYRIFDEFYKSFSEEDMNGNTLLITKAADMAVSKGIVVVNSAGNQGDMRVDNKNTLSAPADGDSVIAAGAVDNNGKRAFFSSSGPTTSNPPRIKPDLMAMGMGVFVASPKDSTSYYWASGTSFSCPLLAGVVALVLNAHPEATPMEVIEALKKTSDRAENPDSLYGWGVPNTAAAIDYLNK